MRRLVPALPLLLAGMAFQAAARADTPVDLELALLVDVSLSIDADEARLQRRGYVEAFRDRYVIGAIRSGVSGRIAVAYFEWAGTGQVRPIRWSISRRDSPAACSRESQYDHQDRAAHTSCPSQHRLIPVLHFVCEFSCHDF